MTTLHPNDLVDRKLVELIQNCVEGSVLDEGTRASAQRVLEQNKTARVRYLMSEGESLWNQFVKEAAEGSAAGLIDRPSLLSLPDAIRSREDDGLFNTSRSRNSVRLALSLLLLVVGFILIASVYLGMPLLISRFQQLSDRISGGTETIAKLEAVADKLPNGLEDNWARVERVHRQLDEWAVDAAQIRVVADAMRSHDVKNLSKAVASATKSVSAVETSLDSVLTASQASSAEKTQKDTWTGYCPTKQPMKDLCLTLASVSVELASIRKKIQSDQDANKIIADLAKRASRAATEASRLNDNLRSRVDVPTLDPRWEQNFSYSVAIGVEANKRRHEKLVEFTRKLFTQATADRDAIKKSYEDALFEGSLRDLEESLKEKVTGNRIVDASSRQLLEELSDAVANLQSTLADSLGKLEEARMKLSKTVEPLADLTDERHRVILAAKISAEEIMGELEPAIKPFSVLATVSEDMKATVQEFRAVGELQSDLAFKGGSPGVLLLFLIGGMLVTVGLTSLLRWLKQREQLQATEYWDRRADVYTTLATEMLVRGLDPVPVLRQIHAAHPETPNDQHDVSTPIAEIIRSIATAIKKP